jgi:hypothetical protein
VIEASRLLRPLKGSFRSLRQDLERVVRCLRHHVPYAVDENSRYTSRADVLRKVPAAVRFISAVAWQSLRQDEAWPAS